MIFLFITKLALNLKIIQLFANFNKKLNLFKKSKKIIYIQLDNEKLINSKNFTNILKKY